MTGRTPTAWVGKTPDSKVPASVRARVFLTHKGRCHISGRVIRPGEAWELEHIKPLSMGGEHAESNMAPALVAPHRAKTAKEAGARSKADRIRAKHLGIFPESKAKIPARKNPWGFRRQA